MNAITMGQRIAEQRKKLGLSQEALGEKMGVSRQAISKWESDGTVPEIDKLIGLSRLFSVSVGWLLGVEEQTPPQPDGLTESQLKMVEEIVKRYQPQPEPGKKEFYWFPLVLFFLFAFFICYLRFGPKTADYSGQIGSLQSSYQAIQGELQALSGRVEDIAAAAEEAEELLHSYAFQMGTISTGGMELDETTPGNQLPDGIAADSSIVVDIPVAPLTFTAVPKQHADTDKAWLVVLLGGQPLGQTECVWTGAGYMAEFSLWVEDGYEYRFVIEHEDGTQQIQMLEEYIYNDLAYGTSLHCTIDCFVWSYDPQSWIFEVADCYVQAVKPNLGDYADTQWTEAGLLLYRNGDELERRVDLVENDPWDAGDYELIREYWGTIFHNIKLEEGDDLKLTFYASLDNGMSIEATAGRWALRDGNLDSLTEE